MYCKNCGNEVNQNAVACLSCGSDPKRGNKHCHGCGVETNPEQIICVKCGVSLKNQTFNLNEIKRKVMEGSSNSNVFPIPLGAAWIINVIGWVLFVSTMNHGLELLTSLLCLGCVYVGIQHKKINTPPFLDNERLSANNLIYASAFEAIWMFAWGIGLFGF